MNIASRFSFLLLVALSGFAADGAVDPLPHEAAERVWMEIVRSYNDPFIKMKSFVIPETALIFKGKPGSSSLAYANLIYNCDKEGFVSGRDPKIRIPIAKRMNIERETILFKKVVIQLILQYQSDMREKNEAAKKTHPLEMEPPAEAYINLFAENGTEKDALQSIMQFFHKRDADIAHKKNVINWDRLTALLDDRSLVIIHNQNAYYFCFGYAETSGKKYLVTAGVSSDEKKDVWGYRVVNVRNSISLPELVEIRPWIGDSLEVFVFENWTRDEARLKQRIDEIVKNLEER